MRSNFKNVVVGVLVAAVVSGCTAHRPIVVQNPLLSGMVDRGPVPLSKDNPYVAANLFLAKQMEKSPELKGFIEHKGVPSAIEVGEGKISDVSIAFYYPLTNESYELEQASDMWVIRGPFTLQRDKQRELNAIDKTGETPGATQNGTTVAMQQVQTAPATSESADARARAFVPFESPALPATLSQEGLQQSLDEMKIKEYLKVSPAPDGELTPKGDLVHYVTEANETIESIARWYSFDTGNAEKLARINRVASKNALEVGDSIIVPSYMVKNKARLTPAGLKIIDSHR